MRKTEKSIMMKHNGRALPIKKADAISFDSYKNRIIKVVDLSLLNLDSKKIQTISIDDPECFMDISSSLNKQ